jgi:hypothetical protein
VFLLGGLAACAAASPPPAKPPLAGSQALTEFLAAARQMGISYEAPAGFTETPVRENADQAYFYAVLSADKRIEMRFVLRPYDQMPEVMRNRQMGFTFFMTGISNLVHGGEAGKFSKGEPLPAAHYNADEAILIPVRWFRPDTGANAFGNGYALCTAVFMHREGVGDAYTFVLFKDMDALQGMTEERMLAMRFAPR